MKSPRPEEPAGPPGAEPEGTGLPGFRTWRGAYLFVLGSLAAYVVLLAVLTRVFES